MKYDILVIGGGASGLMAAMSAARSIRKRESATGDGGGNSCASLSNGADTGGGSHSSDGGHSAGGLLVGVLEKMPRPARKIMISGKGRCNFTNLKDWNGFSAHIKANAQFLRPAFHAFGPEGAIKLFESLGMPSVVERGDRAFPSSYKSSDVVDALVRGCLGEGVKIETEFEVAGVTLPDSPGGWFKIDAFDGRSHYCRRLILATGGLSYPATGSTGDGIRWAEGAGHRICTTFPSLTAVVPKGYKEAPAPGSAEMKGHIPRSTPLSAYGQKLCGIHLKNICLHLLADTSEVESEFGELDFTDCGIEGAAEFNLSRKAVKLMMNGAKTSLSLDLKPGEDENGLAERISALSAAINEDPRSRRLSPAARQKVLLGKLLPRELVEAFPPATTPRQTAKLLKDWRFELEGFTGYERAVVTAGGVSTADVVPKTMESRLVKGLYFCGEMLDVDADTGGYNLQCAFSTGSLAGTSAAKSLSDAAAGGKG